MASWESEKRDKLLSRKVLDAVDIMLVRCV